MLGFEVCGDVAVLTLENPPVNSLGLELRRGIVEALERAEDTPSVRAVVIIGSGKGFSGGADIREFGTPKALAAPHLLSVLRTAEDCAKPVVAAIGGICMGGGFELALACHYRVAAADAQLGLPEVKLGLLPGRRRHPAPAARDRGAARAQHDHLRQAAACRGVGWYGTAGCRAAGG
jgi:3-hydroxyacyl-CoA dehydrogenase